LPAWPLTPCPCFANARNPTTGKTLQVPTHRSGKTSEKSLVPTSASHLDSRWRPASGKTGHPAPGPPSSIRLVISSGETHPLSVDRTNRGHAKRSGRVSEWRQRRHIHTSFTEEVNVHLSFAGIYRSRPPAFWGDSTTIQRRYSMLKAGKDLRRGQRRRLDVRDGKRRRLSSRKIVAGCPTTLTIPIGHGAIYIVTDESQRSDRQPQCASPLVILPTPFRIGLRAPPSKQTSFFLANNRAMEYGHTGARGRRRVERRLPTFNTIQDRRAAHEGAKLEAEPVLRPRWARVRGRPHPCPLVGRA